MYYNSNVKVKTAIFQINIKEACLKSSYFLTGVKSNHEIMCIRKYTIERNILYTKNP